MTSPLIHNDEENRLLSRRTRLTLTCISAALNAATAGGIFTFPLIAESSDISRFHMTQPQLSTIVLVGMAGQYLFAPAVGSVIDQFGPWSCSLASVVLFSSGFGLFSLEFRNTPEITFHLSSWTFYRLVFSYFLAGLGTATSAFSALFAASKNFPQYSGVATGGSLALFGLSPLILSFFASTWFVDPQRGLDVANYTAFLAILTGVVNLIGAINMKVEPQLIPVSQYITTGESPEDPASDSETTPLLGRKPVSQTYDNVWNVLRDVHFWILALVVLLTLGSCEMVISNIGTIALALPVNRNTSPLSAASNIISASRVSTAATQVRLLSLSNTIARVTTGLMADFVSPTASFLPSGLLALPSHHRISRVAFLVGPCLLMSSSFLWMAYWVASQNEIWAFSIGIGVSYGSIFTALPSLIGSIWGHATLARNFGFVSYSPFIGTSIFSYLYAFVANAATNTKGLGGYAEGICIGKECWRLTFCICAGCGLLAASLSALLWRSWRGRV